ncbi:hypothetical protein DL98DRAFT_588842 [Cadophora sp. DSE1049]|nr:hypothetical protein DL98DRAFT_588842 [Cadophora sp. DSE1049]
MSFLQFMNLVPELQELVARNCEAHELLALAQTCSSLHGLAIRALYYDVDISVHNLPGYFPCFYGGTVDVLAQNPRAELGSRAQTCHKRQDMFVDALKLHPEHGQRVVRLTWTYFDRWDPVAEEFLNDEPLWVALQVLKAVKYLDFAVLTWQRELVPPPPLFPRAQHIRLLGEMSFAFVRAILLSSDPENFISLDLDNLQDYGEFHGGDFVNLADLSLIPEHEDDQGNPVVRHPGTMRGHLRRLEGRCRNLRRLSLRSVGNDDHRDAKWSQTIDEARYQEWAAFIHSTRFTLECLTIEQGLEPTQTNIGRCRPQRIHYGLPMEDRFIDHLLPTLLTGSFPKLKDLRVYGIGAPPRSEMVQAFRPKHPDIRGYVDEKLSAAFGPGVELEVREHATKRFYYHLNGATYDS